MVVNFDLADMNQEETPLDRELQATELARIMSASYPDPLIFLGYVVTSPHAERRECFRAFGDNREVPVIMYSPLCTVPSRALRYYGQGRPRSRHR
jgi:hypothetical protein